MGSSVYLRLKDGRLVSMLNDVDPRAAQALKENLDKWVKAGQTLSVTHATGKVEDLTPTGVQTVEVVEAPQRPPGPGAVAVTSHPAPLAFAAVPGRKDRLAAPGARYYYTIAKTVGAAPGWWVTVRPLGDGLTTPQLSEAVPFSFPDEKGARDFCALHDSYAGAEDTRPGR
jgi:hypothetical protein